MANTNRKRVDSADPIVQAVLSDSTSNTKYSVLSGFVGPSQRKGFVRIYLSLELDDYAEIEADEIIHRIDTSSPIGGSLIWIKSESKLAVNSRTTPTGPHGIEYLGGDISARMMTQPPVVLPPGGAGGGGFAGSYPRICRTVDVCKPTDVGCSTVIGPVCPPRF